MIGYLLESARCQENRAYYRRLIDFVSARGINTLIWHFTDDQGCTLQFDSAPGIASPHAYSKTEMRELIAYARGHGITIIPELASLGHSRYITNLPAYRHLDEIEHTFTGMCPVAPETREVLSRLVTEVVDVFDSPYIHVGLDEANIGHHPLTRQALETRTRGEIFADHINFMHSLVSQHGRRMVMWGDGILHDRTIAPLISRDIVICDWQYRAVVPADSVQYFLDEGFDVILCPAMISHDATLFPTDSFAMANLTCMLGHLSLIGKGKILGVVNTVWQPERYMHDAMWLAFDVTAAMMRAGRPVDRAQQIARFANAFHGFNPSAQWIEAAADYFRLCPMRTEWLAIAKSDLAKMPEPAQLHTSAARWAEIFVILSGAADQVTQNAVAYRTFTLVAEVLAHFYGKAVQLADGSQAPPWNNWLETERHLLARVEAIWDSERFADDPRKFAPPRECFRDNHFIILLRSAAEATAQRCTTHAAMAVAVTPGPRQS